MKPPTRKAMMERLEFFTGTWTVEIIHPHIQPNPIVGRSHFDWLDEAYIIQRTQIDQPEFPDSTIIYDWNPASNLYVQHYFDSRGVTRLYQMRFEGGVWKLWREKADFSSLDFHQRFIGNIDETGNEIEGKWEQSQDGTLWKPDFKLAFRRKTDLL